MKRTEEREDSAPQENKMTKITDPEIVSLKLAFEMFLLGAGSGMLLLYLLFATHPQVQDQPVKPYTETYINTCDIYNVCNYTAPLLCPSIDCKPTYQCWMEKRNCVKNGNI